MTHTRTDAEHYVTTSITGDAFGTLGPEYDLDAIVDDLAMVAGSWNFENIDSDTFWAAVARHDSTQA